MSSMVLSQLLNPEASLDRKASSQAPDLTTGDKGPSRYDEIVRQQEKRLEQKRVEERRQAKAEVQAQHESRRAERSAASSQPPKADRQGSSVNPADRQAESVQSRQDNKAVKTPDKSRPMPEDTRTAHEDPALQNEPVNVDPFMAAVPPAQIFTGPLTLANGSSALANPLAGAGQLPGTGTTAGVLFAALLNADGEPAGGNLLGGLQGGAAQLSGEAAGKFAGLLMTAAASPEMPQPLGQPGSLRGAEAQALMRGYATSVDTPVGQSEWGEKIMGKLAWLTASQMAVAEIHITPPELGPLDVRVQVQNDQATVTVHATTPAVREQLELHGHRLREMLSEQGFSLEGFDVTDSAGREASDQDGSDEPDHGTSLAQKAGLDGTDETDGLETGSLDLSWRGEVDVFV